jgi:hypothetical protein
LERSFDGSGQTTERKKMPSYLTQDDVNNFGTELLDVVQRASIQAVAPKLDRLQQENAALQSQLARETRNRLDAALEEAVPDYRQIDGDQRWHNYLRGIDPLSGNIRQANLDAAIDRGDSGSIIAHFQQFQAQHGGTGEGPAHSSRRRTAPPAHQGGMLTRARIAELYELHRRGKLTGDAWARTEEAIIASARNGMVPDALDPHGRR